MITSPITPEAILELTDISDPSMAPDGKSLAFVRSRVDPIEKKVCSNIMMIALPGGTPFNFTSGPKDGMPRFSTAGDVIGFLRNDCHGVKQVWTISLHGGEAKQVTSIPGGVSEYAWSPDSSHLILVSNVDPDTPTGEGSKQSIVRTVNRIRYRTDTGGWQGDAFARLFVADAVTGHATQLTFGEGDDRAPRWSPDGRSIAFTSDRRSDRDFTNYREAYVMPASGGEPDCWSEGLPYIDALAWSPDGSRLVVIGADDAEMWDPRQRWLFVISPHHPPVRLTDGSITPLFAGPGLHWTGRGDIVFIADSRGQSYLCSIKPDGSGLRKINGGGTVYIAAALDASCSIAAIVCTTPVSPAEIKLCRVDTGSCGQITHFNSEYLDAHPRGATEKFSIVRNGMEIESRLVFPPDFDPSKRYPLVLDIHGGPNARFDDKFLLTHHILATAGYVVLGVNPRGSSSFGVEFEKAVFRDWGGEDFQDILAALDAACQRPFIDRERLGIHGYSYGGYMGSWALGHDQRFKAAVIGAPCINLLSMYGTSDIGVSFGDIQWGEMPMISPAPYLDRSPLLYARNIKAPILLMHGESDYRVPMEQSEQFYVALKRLGKEVEFVRFPGCSHGFVNTGEPLMRIEYLKRMLAWFDNHLKRISD